MNKHVGFSGTLAARCGILKPKTDSLLSRAFRFFNLNRKPTGQHDLQGKLKVYRAYFSTTAVDEQPAGSITLIWGGSGQRGCSHTACNPKVHEEAPVTLYAAFDY